MFEEGLTIAANLATDGFKKGTKEIERAVKTLSNSVKRFGTQMTSKIKSLIPMIIGVGSAYGVISKGVSAFMSQNEELSQRMNSIWTSIGNLLGPIITKIIDWVSTAVSYLLSFLKLLGITGKASSNASNASKQASSAAKELQRTLAGFDELNVLQDNSNNDGGGGGGNQNPLKELEPTEWMKKIAELLKAGMFEEAGRELSRQLNKLIEMIPWAELGQKLRGFFLGVLQFLIGAIDEFDWKALGDGIRTFIINLFSNPEEIIETIKRFIHVCWNAALDFLWGLLYGDTEEEPPIIESLRKLGEAIEHLADVTGAKLKEFWEGTLKPFGEWLLEKGLPDAIDSITTELQRFADLISGDMNLLEFIGSMTTLEKIAIAVGIAIGGIKLTSFIEAASKANGVLPLLVQHLGGSAAGFKTLIAAIGGINPIVVAVIAVIAALAAEFVHLYNKNEEFRQKIDEIWSNIKSIFEGFFTSVRELFNGDIGLAEFIGRIVGGLAQLRIQIDEGVKSFFEALGGELWEKITGLWDKIKEAWQQVVDWWKEKAFEDGKFTFQGLLDGIVEKITGIGEWIKTKILEPFVTGFRDAFDMHSPSKVMLDLGKDILQGLIDGVQSLLPNLDTMREGITKAWTGLKETVSGWWDSVKSWFTGAEETSQSADGMETSLNNASGAASDSSAAIQTAATEYADAYSAIATSASETAQAVETSVTKIKDDTTTNIDATSEKVKTSSEEIKNNVVTSLEQLNSEAESQLNMLSSSAESIFTQLASNASVWGSDLMIQFINGINAQIPELVNTLVGIADTVNSYIGFSLPEKGPLSDFDKSGPDMVDLFAEGMEGKTGRLTEALNSIAENVAYRAPGIAGGAMLPYAVSAASGGEGTGGGDDVMERLFELISGLEDAIMNGQFVIDFGDFRAAAKKITKIQRQMARAEGV